MINGLFENIYIFPYITTKSDSQNDALDYSPLKTVIISLAHSSPPILS